MFVSLSVRQYVCTYLHHINNNIFSPTIGLLCKVQYIYKLSTDYAPTSNTLENPHFQSHKTKLLVQHIISPRTHFLSDEFPIFASLCVRRYEVLCYVVEYDIQSDLVSFKEG